MRCTTNAHLPCRVCNKPRTLRGCTNGVCPTCHDRHCTSGGDAKPIVTPTANMERIAKTWNALEGIADPERAVPALVEALRDVLDESQTMYPRRHFIQDKARAALALLDD